MSATKIVDAVLLLLGAWCCGKTFTSPTAAPSKEEQRQYKEYKATDTMVVPVGVLTGMYQVFYYVLNIIELAAALGIKNPHTYLPTFLQSLPRPSRNLSISSPERMIGLAMIFAGTTLRIICYRHMQNNFTFQLAVRKDHKLVTDGPYAYVRHPSYIGGCNVIVGCLLFNLGRGSWWAECAVASGSPWLLLGVFQFAWAAMFLYGAIPRCKVEDDVLREHFKEEWVQWAKRTPYRMIPFVY